MLRLEPVIPSRCPHAPSRQPLSTVAGPASESCWETSLSRPSPRPPLVRLLKRPVQQVPHRDPNQAGPSAGVPLSEGLASGSCLLAISWAVCPPPWGIVFPRVARAEPEIGRAPPSLAFRETFQKCLVE